MVNIALYKKFKKEKTIGLNSLNSLLVKFL